MNEPERAGGDDDDRTGEREPPARRLAARAQRGQRGRDGDDHEELPDFDADVERKQRPAERARRQVHLPKHVREPEAVNEAEGERNPRPHVASAAHQQVVGADVDDAQRDGRLDDAAPAG